MMLCSSRAFVRQAGLDSPKSSGMISSQLDATSFCICPKHLDVSSHQAPPEAWRLACPRAMPLGCPAE